MDKTDCLSSSFKMTKLKLQETIIKFVTIYLSEGIHCKKGVKGSRVQVFKELINLSFA
jgi:hypothetical protein